MSRQDSERCQIVVRVDGPPDVSAGEVIAALVQSIARVAVAVGRDPAVTFDLAAQAWRESKRPAPQAEPVTFPAPGGVS